jgi:beta-phosphoglucomutase
MTVQALLFDLDGTLIDSMPLHHVAWREWHAEVALPFDEDGFFLATAGRTNQEILAELFPSHSDDERGAMAERKEDLYCLAAATQLGEVRGALAAMRQARERGLKLAICTAAPNRNIAVAFDRFALGDLVETTVSPEQGFRGKPHPDLFTEAARRLDVPASACLVFEDAPLGVEAARRAGMPAFALTTTMPATAFESYPNLRGTAPDFLSVDLDRLLRSVSASQ